MCSSGIEEIAGAAQSTPDKRAACGCLKNLLAILSGIEPEEIARIPSMCDVNMPCRKRHRRLHRGYADQCGLA
jgi:hypothetical protein